MSYSVLVLTVLLLVSLGANLQAGTKSPGLENSPTSVTIVRDVAKSIAEQSIGTTSSEAVTTGGLKGRSLYMRNQRDGEIPLGLLMENGRLLYMISDVGSFAFVGNTLIYSTVGAYSEAVVGVIASHDDSYSGHCDLPDDDSWTIHQVSATSTTIAFTLTNGTNDKTTSGVYDLMTQELTCGGRVD